MYWASSTLVLHNCVMHVLICMHLYNSMCYTYLSVANNDGVLNRQTMAAGSLAGYQWFDSGSTVVAQW